MKYILLFLIVAVGCTGTVTKTPDEGNVVKRNSREIIVKDTGNSVASFLEMVSFVPLSDEVLIGNVIKTLLYENKIYVLDDTPRLQVFDMQGKALYQIGKIGHGHQELLSLHDFAIKPDSRQVVIYDDARNALCLYRITDGTFGKSQRIHTCFYDIEKDELIYSGILPLPVPTTDFPFYGLIEGVYDDTFFAVIPPQIFGYLAEKNPEVLTGALSVFTSGSNPIIAFYRRTPTDSDSTNL
ncbi:MAG: 6-bladed beta-propeller [Capnocytophaga sp.]|nr:6-bladed beta-propeller [Capnocytophaga sp.]